MGYNALDAVKDYLNGSIEYVALHIQDDRTQVCKRCTELLHVPMTSIGTCKKCGCFMDAKVKLGRATCPLDKWEK